MRCNVVTMKFWGTVYKLFKGKALRFFRGFMAGGPAADEGQSRQATFADECQFNMVVPSSKSIRKYMSDYKLDTSTPGILKSSINTFVKFHGVREYVKLSIDGKKTFV